MNLFEKLAKNTNLIFFWGGGGGGWGGSDFILQRTQMSKSEQNI